MRVTQECLPCQKRLVNQATKLATSDPKLRERIKTVAFDLIKQKFPSRPVPASIANELHAMIKLLSNNPDPYRKMKDKELTTARDVFKKIKNNYRGDLRSRVELAAIGNVLDFFKDPDAVRRDAFKRPKFAVDEIEEFGTQLKQAKEILYLADNAGECFFDLPLVEHLRTSARTYYVVKGDPIQDDITREDLKRAGMLKQMGDILSTGAAMVGLDLARTSQEFREKFDAADLIVAKGMGYYETLSELPQTHKVFYILKAKCNPVADNLGISLDDFVAKFG